MNKTTTGIIALIIGILAISGTAFAFGWGLNSENREAIEDAIEANDYNAWKEAMIETLTEEEFNKLVEMNQNRKIAEQNKQIAEKALEEGDYETWKEAMEILERPKITELITEENFDTFVKLHEAKMNGDYETIQELSEELGFGMRRPCGHRMFGSFGKMGGRMGGLVPLEWG